MQSLRGVSVSTASLFPHKIAADVVVWGVAPILAYLFRFDGTIPAEALPGLAWFAGIGLVLKVVAVIAFRLNIQSWKHASFRDTVAIGRAVVAVGVAEVAVGLAIHAAARAGNATRVRTMLREAVPFAAAAD